MLRLDVTQIPPEGLDISRVLEPGDVHFRDGEEEWSLESGGTLSCHVELRDEDTVHVSGRLAARLGLACGRCLDGFGLDVAQKLELFFLPHREDQEEEDEVELSERDMVVAYYRDRSIDLGEIVREQLFLAIPMKRLCREACAGLCPSCGANRNHQRCDCPPLETDTPFASLRGLLGS